MGRKLQGGQQRRGRRARSIEPLEDRRVMAGDLVGAVSHHGFSEVDSSTEPPALVNHLHPNADFWFDSSAEREIEALVGDLQQTLASTHNGSGVAQARNDYGFIGTGQTVAVIDSGIAWDHYALGGGLGSNYRVVGGWDFTENDATPYDEGPHGGHGTHVAGIVGADRSGTADDGVAPGVDLVSLRVFNDAGEGYFSWVESALQWVIQNRNSFENPITAVNLSLGTDWNSTSLPGWAMLENEFAQLEAAGVFISVSAGNSFASYGTAGLSYPAVSPYVVPVMSVDASGSLSSFSQRHTSAIAAPGRWIVSTVPDYIGNQNGVNDDFGSMSGTSMAAPYVAGASVLVREAMQFVGYTNITQDQIFSHMMSTATSIWDAATGQWYKRLNVSSALNALMPADEYGSTSATAFNLGAVSDGQQIAGLIGKLSDADYFRFTAGTTGTVSFTASTTHGLAPVWTGSGGVVSGSQGETFTFQVVAGQSYTFGLSTSGGIGYYTLNVDVQTVFTFSDWGTVAYSQVNDQNISGETWYRVQASQAGYLTAQAFFASAGGAIELAWFDANQQPLAAGTSATDSARADRLVSAGQELYLRVRGVNADVDFRVTNLVSLAGTTVTVSGTSGADSFSFTTGSSQHTLNVNGTTYQFQAASVSHVNLSGGAGRDALSITGSAGTETVTVQVGQATVVGSRLTISAVDFEDLTINGGGGSDVAVLHDSAGDDQLTLWQRRGRIIGDTFSHEVRNFNQITAYASLGNDRAAFYDSAGDDVFTARPTQGVMQGSGFTTSAWNFDRYQTYATAGGNDRALFYDSAGDDLFIARPTHAILQGAGYVHTVWNFSRTAAYATAGGFDRALFYDSAGDDLFTTMPDRANMIGSNFNHIAWGFERAEGHSTAGGNDRAVFYDSAGDDTYIAQPNRATMQGSNFLNIACGFRRTLAQATAGGNDRARLYDSTGNDSLVTAAWGAYLCGDNFRNDVRGFGDIAANLSAGGTDSCSLAATDYLFNLVGLRTS